MPRPFATARQAAEHLARAAGRTRTTDGKVSDDLIAAMLAGGMIDDIYAQACRRSRPNPAAYDLVVEARLFINRSIARKRSKPCRQPS